MFLVYKFLTKVYRVVNELLMPMEGAVGLFDTGARAHGGRRAERIGAAQFGAVVPGGADVNGGRIRRNGKQRKRERGRIVDFGFVSTAPSDETARFQSRTGPFASVAPSVGQFCAVGPIVEESVEWLQPQTENRARVVEHRLQPIGV